MTTSRLFTRARTSLAVAVCLVPLFVTTAAVARPEYPQEMLDAVPMTCVPQCTLCHTSPSGGANFGAFGGAFFTALAASGKTNDPESVRPAVEYMRGMKTNSDTDPTTDIEELAAGLNPAVPGGILGCPEYGCGARIAKPAPSGSSSAPYVIGALSVLGFLGGRAAKRRRSRSNA